MAHKLIIPFLLFAFFSSCKQQKNIAQEADYVQYLSLAFSNDKKEATAKEISFWSARLQQDTGSYINKMELAVHHLAMFRHNGQINHLLTGDSLLKNASRKLNDTDPELLYSLSQNCIMQHQFNAASAYNDAAVKASGDPFTIKLLQFDTYMELGRYAEAYAALQSLKDKSAFDYLIRKAKWEDHKGNLDGAIVLMEQAFDKVKDKKKSLYIWTRSNLADMYGHAGRVEEAYAAYLDVLKKDPANLYCLKGIAWIAWSHDNNGTEAKRILQFILAQTEMPDLKLLLAEICEAEGDEAGKRKWEKDFLTTIAKPGYGGMYNKYLIGLYNQDKELSAKALPIAEAELKNRFTPETNDWLAWTYYNQGQIDKAYAISKQYVYNKTFEPDAVLHTAYIFAANGNKAEAKAMLKECLGSSFEIGPLTTKEIKAKLETL